MGPKTHAQAKEMMRKKDSNLAKPSNSEIYLETYKRKPGRTYKTNTDEVKYAEVQALVDAGKIAEANALVVGGKTHGQNWLVGRQDMHIAIALMEVKVVVATDAAVIKVMRGIIIVLVHVVMMVMVEKMAVVASLKVPSSL
ncbi:hypothetical protein POM88_001734 [Heracleum sosnowskyi]|uniref:Uncharacterized protein n=1 Tax=Heracleum sosnowskyi TaxID=360622 RepID=A0AAD8JDJ7_9APIA|nr:hypothetical protein POM88_001734 [Heracleum sosnowskyi]